MFSKEWKYNWGSMRLITSFGKLTVFVLSVSSFMVLVSGNHQLEGIGEGDPQMYTHLEILDSDSDQPEKRYYLEWVVQWDQKEILFNVTVKTEGAIAFGLSTKGEIPGADVIIAGVDDRGFPYLTDMYGDATGKLKKDPSQDWTLHSAKESCSYTTVIFCRKFDTCDDNDFIITDQTITLLWAYSERETDWDTQPINWGTYSVHLLDPNLVPRTLKEAALLKRQPSPEDLRNENLKLWNVNNTINLLPQETLYHCSVHRSPHFGRKHQVVGYNTNLDELARKHIHHLIFFQCIVPTGTSAAEIFEQFVGGPGEACYVVLRPSGRIPTNYCIQIKGQYGAGQGITFLPDHTGIPIGDSGDPREYFMLQVHYDNPDKAQFSVDLNIQIYYTDQLRPNDGGITYLGHYLPGSPSILIPPGEDAHSIYGHCSSFCTKKLMTAEGIKLAVLGPHTHLTGTKVKLRHFRGNEELPWVFRDDNYDNLSQGGRVLRKETRVLPGDHLIVQCEYDVSLTNGSVVGGFGSRQEMCFISTFYYKWIQYFLCDSEILDQEYMQRYLEVNNKTWDNEQLDYVATSPRHLAGLSMKTISDKVNWTSQLRSSLQHDHKYFPQNNVCPTPTAPLTNTTTVIFPKGVKEYVPPAYSRDECYHPKEEYLYSSDSEYNYPSDKEYSSK